MLELPAVGNLERRHKVHWPGLYRAAVAESGAPPGVAGVDDAGKEIAQRKGHRQHLVLFRGEDGDGADFGRRGLELRGQAVVVDGRGHQRQAALGQAQMGDGREHHARS
jgi:hypothetical protein